MTKLVSTFVFKQKKIYSLFFISQLFCENILILNAKTKQPLPEVNVFSSNYGTTTDSNGTFSLIEFQDKESVVISHIGYEVKILKKNQFPEIINLIPISLQTESIHVLGTKSKSKRTNYNKLERDVLRVYPYANLIGNLISNYSSVLDSINNLNFFSKRREKRKIFYNIENELIAKYGNKIQKLTKTQGKILIRLVDRETKKNSFVLIKEFRGFLVAGIWQITARIFGHNLKTTFNPDFGEDHIIENIIQNTFGK
tara:strand:+ start:1470 stop:2234 length:765 start_codon:yes stop_codon:yes gene_type:complete